MFTRARRPLASALTALVLTVLGAASAADDVSSSDVYRFADGGAVAGASSTLVRGDDHIGVVLVAGDLEPLAPYTLWWVIFNSPQDCIGACDTDDIFFPDGTMNINPDADIAILYGDGLLTDEYGVGAFSAVLFEGSALGEVVYGPGLRDAATAEVHLVVRSHGPLDADLVRAYLQLSTFEPHPTIGGACELCADTLFAVHLATAR
jgi:hypothetical protein